MCRILGQRTQRWTKYRVNLNKFVGKEPAHGVLHPNFMAAQTRLKPKQNKIKSHTLNQSEAFRGIACVINSLPININSRRRIIQMRRTCRCCNYLRFRAGTNLLTAFSIETTLVERSRGFFRLWLLSWTRLERKTFLITVRFSYVFATLHDCTFL